MYRTIAAGLFAAALLGAAHPANAQTKITLSWAIAPQHLQPIITSPQMQAKKEIFKHLGKSYEVEPVRVVANAIAAMASNRTQIVAYPYQLYALAVLKAKLDVRVVGDLLATGTEGHYSPPMMVKKSSGIKAVKDLKGKRIGILARGTGFDAALRVTMRAAGLRADRDYTIVELPIPRIFGALQDNKIDAGFLLAPFTVMAKRTGQYQPVFEFGDSLGATQTVVLTARASWIAKNRAATVDFMEDYIRGWRYTLDPKNRDEVLNIVAAVTKRPVQAYKGWMFTKNDEFRHPWMEPNLTMLQRNIDDLVREKILPAGFDVAKYSDLSLIREARKRIEGEN